MDETFLDRLKSAMEKKGISTFKELADGIGVDPNTITNWVSKGEISRGSSRLAVANFLQVNIEWLNSGAGKMDLGSDPARRLRELRLREAMKSGDQENQKNGFDITITSPPFLGAALMAVKRFLRKRALGLSDESESQLVVRVVKRSVTTGQEPTEADVEQELVDWIQGR